MLVAIGNTDSYGGGMRIVPGADPTDGLLDVVVAGPLGAAHADPAAAEGVQGHTRRGTRG